MTADRLWSGEYSTRELTQESAWHLFLHLVADLVPDVIANLQTDVLPVYSATSADIHQYADSGVKDAKRIEYQERHGVQYAALCDSGEDPSDWQTLKIAGLNRHGNVVYPDLLPLRETLEAWATRWHLAVPRMFEAALTTLHVWHEYPYLAYPSCAYPRDTADEVWATESPESERLDWLVYGGHSWECATRPADRVFSFQHAGWEPTAQTRQSAAAAIRSDFEQRLCEYLDAIETHVEAADSFERSKEYRSIGRHVEWLVRYQVNREPWPTIAVTADRELANGRRVPVADDFVARAAKAVADLLGLTLDPVRGPGRPMGSRDREPRHTV